MRQVGLPIQGLLFLTVAMALPQAASGQEVQWQTNPQAALQQSSVTGRPVLMKFTAEWCGYCKKMERTTFADPGTAEVVNRNFVPLLIDFDEHRDLGRQLKVTGLPAILIVAPDMTILERISGYKTAQQLLPKLNAVVAAYRPTPRIPALTAAQKRTTPPIDQNPFADNPFANQGPVAPSINAAMTQAGSATENSPEAHTQPAFNGLCLTSVVDERELIRGSDAFAAQYRGQVLHFRDAAQRDLFFQTPEKYWPMLEGTCVTTLLETGKLIPGQLRHAAVFRNRIWLFQNRARMTQFIESPDDHVGRIEERQKQSKTANRSY